MLNHLNALQQPLADLSYGTVEGDWEGALELVGRVADALRQVGACDDTATIDLCGCYMRTACSMPDSPTLIVVVPSSARTANIHQEASGVGFLQELFCVDDSNITIARSPFTLRTATACNRSGP